MKTILILVGKTQSKIFKVGIDDYVSRVEHYMPFSIATIPELKNTKSLSEDQQKQKEGELILKEIQPSDTVVLLDEHGAEFRSIEYANWLKKNKIRLDDLFLSLVDPMVFPQMFMHVPMKRSHCHV